LRAVTPFRSLLAHPPAFAVRCVPFLAVGLVLPPSFLLLFFFSSRRRHTRSVSAFLLNRSSDLEPLKATSYMAVGFYVAKYVNKKSDMDLAAKGLGAKEWNNSLKTKLSLLPKKLFRIRMSRNFGMKMLTMTNLSTECL